VCPVCIGALALVVAKGAIACGLAAVAVTKVRAKDSAEINAVPKSNSQYQNVKENSL